MFALLIHDPALLKLLIYKLCMTTHSLANSALWLLSDWEDFQEKVVVTFYSVLLVSRSTRPQNVSWPVRCSWSEKECNVFGLLCYFFSLVLFIFSLCLFIFLFLRFFCLDQFMLFWCELNVQMPLIKIPRAWCWSKVLRLRCFNTNNKIWVYS